MHDVHDATLDPARIASLLVAAKRATSARERQLLEEPVVHQFLPLAECLARRYQGRGVDTDDLDAVARIALVDAMRRFDPAAGGFAAFATATILGEIKKYFRDRVWMVRPTRSVVEARRQVVDCRESRARAGLETTDRHVADDLGMDPRLVREAVAAGRLFAMDAIDDTSDRSGRSLACGEDGFRHVEDRDLLVRCTRGLTPRERQLVRLRFFEEMTQGQIGEALGVSQVQVSRLLAALTAKLRRNASMPQRSAA